jgi:hypothetical protein
VIEGKQGRIDKTGEAGGEQQPRRRSTRAAFRSEEPRPVGAPGAGEEQGEAPAPVEPSPEPVAQTA